MTKKQDEKIFDFFVIRFQLKNIAIAESPQLKGKSPCVRIQIHCVKSKIAADKQRAKIQKVEFFFCTEAPKEKRQFPKQLISKELIQKPPPPNEPHKQSTEKRDAH